MISLDIETADITSEAVILSVAAIKFELNDKIRETPNQTYQYYLDTAFFRRFDVKTQIAHKRRIDKPTMKWWSQQLPSVRKLAFGPGDPVVDVLQSLRIFCKDSGYIWTRGALDSICLESICRQFDCPLIKEYYQIMDFRTALNLTKNTTISGYCKMPNFDDSVVIKHDPRHDAALDIMMLLWGE